MSRHSLIPLCASVLFLCSCTPETGEPKTDLERLQGTWVFVSIEAEGKPIPKEAYEGGLVIFEKDKMTMERGDQKEVATIKLDPDKKPKWINTISKHGDELLGIYLLEGDNLKICLSKEKGDRPKEFATTPRRNHGLMILRRKKP